MSFLVSINVDSPFGKVLLAREAAVDKLVKSGDSKLHPALFCSEIDASNPTYLRVVRTPLRKNRGVQHLLLKHSDVLAIMEIHEHTEYPPVVIPVPPETLAG